MIQIKFRQEPPEGSVFAFNAFHESVGTVIPFRIGETVLDAQVIEWGVHDNGRWASITVEIPVSFPLLLDGILKIDKESGS